MNIVLRARILGIETKSRVRHVRTPEGVRKYGLPIGSPIVGRAKEISARVRKAPNEPQKRSLSGVDEAATGSRGNNRFDKNGLHWMEPSEYHKSHGMVFYATRQDGGHISVWQDKRYIITDHPRFSASVVSQEGEVIGRKDYFSSPQAAKKWAIEVHNEHQAAQPKFVQREYENFFDNNEGVYGWDWTWGDEDEQLLADAQSDDPVRSKAARRELARMESERLGITVNGSEELDFDVAAHETINTVMSAYEQMYPGFSTLLPYFTLDYAPKSSGRGETLAWNRNHRKLSRVQNNEYKYDTPDPDGENRDWNHTEIGLGASGFGDGFDERKVAHFATSNKENRFWSVDASAVAKATGYEDWQITQYVTLNHEIGHTVGRAAMGELEVDAEVLQQKREEFLTELHGILDYYGAVEPTYSDDTPSNQLGRAISAWQGGPQVLRKSVLRRHISEYAAASVHELIAESWASYVMDEKPSQMTVEIGQLTEYYLLQHMKSEFPNEKAYRDA